MMIVLAALLATTAPLPAATCVTALSLVRLHGLPTATAKMGREGLGVIASAAALGELDCVHAALEFAADESEGTALLLSAISDALDEHPEVILHGVTDGEVTASQVCRYGGVDVDKARTPEGVRAVLQEQRRSVAAVTTAELQQARKQCLEALDGELRKVPARPKAR